MKGGRNSWRGIYPRVRSFIVLKAHPMTSANKVLLFRFHFFVVGILIEMKLNLLKILPQNINFINIEINKINIFTHKN